MNGNARTMWLVSVIGVMFLCVNIYSYLAYQNFSIIGCFSPRQIEISTASEYKSTLQTSHVIGHVNNTLLLFLGKGGAMQNASSIRPIINVSTTTPEKDNGNNITLCSLDPPNLLGPLAGMNQEMGPKALISIFPDMKKGRLRPTECVARERLAIIIPYRNRYPHLHIFLHNIIPFLIRQQADATFFVIEQTPPETFNRGALLNVGFMEAQKLDEFDCFIFHDVDLIPLDDRHLYRCGDSPKHFSVAMNKYNFQLPYFGYFGGVVGFTGHQYFDVNGCSNEYFGWGGEDDDLRERVRNRGYTIVRSPVSIARYDMIKHDRDKGNEDNPFRINRLAIARKRQFVEGLNTITYTLNNITFHHLYTWINVSLNKTDILQNSRHVTDRQPSKMQAQVYHEDQVSPIVADGIQPVRRSR